MIYIASDHAGFDLKQKVINKYLDIEDLGPFDDNPTDYPDYAHKIAKVIGPGNHKGILICGSGIGMCIAANRFSHIRAALCMTPEMARLARQHNDANVICLGAKLISEDQAFAILEEFFVTPFSQEERHIRRIDKMYDFKKTVNPFG